jgi:tetratricopeptide (TPR) repeat protein
MISRDTIKAALESALPDELQYLANDLSQVIAHAASGMSNATEITDTFGNNPDFKVALDHLAGQRVIRDHAIVTFGSDNEFGNITLGDVVAGDFIQVTLTLPQVDNRVSDVVRRSRYLIGAIVFLLSVSAVLIIYQFVSHHLWPRNRVTRMPDSAFNIAIAQFSEVDQDNRIIVSERAQDFTQIMYEVLDSSLGLTMKVWPPSQTGLIDGDTDDERAYAAEQRARVINADVIIYGDLAYGDQTTFSPKFFISDKKFSLAEELVGAYQDGPAIIIHDDITTNPDAYNRLHNDIKDRTQTFVLFVLGLGSYKLGDFAQATAYFQDAEQKWDAEAGKEVLYLFLGSTFGERGDLSSAQTYYTKALTATEQQYARAWLGSANVLVRESTQDGCVAAKIHVANLEEALEGYQRARKADIKPERADVDTKALLGEGKVYLCLSLAGVDNYWHSAEEAFNGVIADFEGGNERVQKLAAESYANLGLIALQQANSSQNTADYEAADTHWERAIALSGDSRAITTYQLWRAHISLIIGDCVTADQHLGDAISTYNYVIEPDPDIEDFLAVIREKRETSQCGQTTSG